MSGHSHFTESIEEYLEAVYRLEREGPGVTTSGLATSLGVAPASVSGMLKKLAKDGYVEQVGRGEVKLTQKGLAVGVRVLRRHRIAERFLNEILGMPWDQVHDEACVLEHAISSNVEARLLKLLKDPTTCPHGQPIPPNDLSDPVRSGEPLAQMPEGTHARIQSVTEEFPEILRYLAEIGLRPGVEISLLKKAPLGGPLTIAVNGKEHAISLELAGLVTVLAA
ncbi:MAG TPA: metal-dependent transcriptional regulator [Candidatus Baltobacteraceae bacterium]|nr:metal-dependent transcriptional regulator [Candidatus Baltobacteraceae bacterium]